MAIDKTLQLEIDLPLADRALLQQMFVDRIEPLLTEAREGGLVHPDYWIDICTHAIDPFLRTPRDVVRLVNATTATYAAVRGEVNPIDFTALETLRLFCPVAYDAVRRRPSAFLLPVSARRDEDGSLGETKRYHEAWGEQLSEADRSRATNLLLRLFPRLGDILGARVLASMPEDTWRTLLLVASEETFPVYFQLAIPSGGISNADLASKLEHFGDTNQFAATLIELARDPGPDAPQRLQAFLSRLENHIGESGEREELEAAMRALFQAANELLRREESGRLDIDISQHLRRIVRRLLLQVEQDERVSLLEEAHRQRRLDRDHDRHRDHARPAARQVRRRVDGGRGDAGDAVAAGAGREPGADGGARRGRGRQPAGRPQDGRRADLLGELEPRRVPGVGVAVDRD